MILKGNEEKPVRCGCGGEAYVDKDFYDMYYVICPSCFTKTDTKKSKEEAVEVWNTAMGTNYRTLMKALVYDATCGICKKNISRQ